MLVPILLIAAVFAPPVVASRPDSAQQVLRVATFNTSLNNDRAGGLIEQLEGDHQPARRIAAVIQRVRPDVILLNEFDFDPDGRAADLFVRRYLGVGQFGERAIRYGHRYSAAVNTGEPSGLALTGDGSTDGPGNAWGFGHHPGQYGMLVLSRFPIDRENVRSFRMLRWAALPGALEPLDPQTGQPFYPPSVWQRLRLSSKSHWDVPIDTPLGRIHLLAAHPTPPVFDGPEDRNGRRNHDEIRLWAEYLNPRPGRWLCDDQGRCGGLPGEARFVIAGDYNADPTEGDSHANAIAQLLQHPRVLDYPPPQSVGAAEFVRAANGADETRRTPVAQATAAFGPRTGNMRIDYVLPSTGFAVSGSGVFWPASDSAEADWLGASDHRLVWVDLRNRASGSDAEIPHGAPQRKDPDR